MSRRLALPSLGQQVAWVTLTQESRAEGVEECKRSSNLMVVRGSWIITTSQTSCL